MIRVARQVWSTSVGRIAVVGAGLLGLTALMLAEFVLPASADPTIKVSVLSCGGYGPCSPLDPILAAVAGILHAIKVIVIL